MGYSGDVGDVVGSKGVGEDKREITRGAVQVAKRKNN